MRAVLPDSRARRFPAVVFATALAASCDGNTPSSPDAPPPRSPSGTLPATLPFTHSAIDQSGIEFVTPLGNLKPPDHTLRTDHIYFYYGPFNPAAAPPGRRRPGRRAGARSGRAAGG
jgi:hypothetical protein